MEVRHHGANEPLSPIGTKREAGFRAARAYLDYRRSGGPRTSPMPDFYIGAHAETAGFTLVTRDTARYRSYFPKLKLITPDD